MSTAGNSKQIGANLLHHEGQLRRLSPRISLVVIPEGWFWMGSNDHYPWEKPRHRVWLDTFAIATTAVTRFDYAMFLADTGHAEPAGWRAPQFGRENQPVVGVNWFAAVRYCEWLSSIRRERFRLPTEAEWEKAARGPDGRVYPWGNDSPTPAHAVFGLKEGVDTVAPVGNRDKGKSPYGVHDMAGNLYEWTMDWYDEEFYKNIPAINPRGPSQGTTKAQRGGSYTNSPYRLRSTFRTKGDPTEHEPNVGFRCAQDIPQ